MIDWLGRLVNSEQTNIRPVIFEDVSDNLSVGFSINNYVLLSHQLKDRGKIFAEELSFRENPHCFTLVYAQQEKAFESGLPERTNMPLFGQAYHTLFLEANIRPRVKGLDAHAWIRDMVDRSTREQSVSLELEVDLELLLEQFAKQQLRVTLSGNTRQAYGIIRRYNSFSEVPEYK